MSQYPDAHTLLEQEGETILTLNRSLYSIMSVIGLCAGLLLLARIAELILVKFQIPLIYYVSPKWFYIAPFFVLVEVFRRRYDDLYVFDRETVTHHHGRLSLNMSVPVVRYEDIRAVSVEQDLLGRIFDYGTLNLNTASTENVEMYIHGVRAPVELGRVVEELQMLSLQRAKKVPVENPYLAEYMKDIPSSPRAGQ